MTSRSPEHIGVRIGINIESWGIGKPTWLSSVSLQPWLSSTSCYPSYCLSLAGPRPQAHEDRQSAYLPQGKGRSPASLPSGSPSPQALTPSRLSLLQPLPLHRLSLPPARIISPVYSSLPPRAEVRGQRRAVCHSAPWAVLPCLGLTTQRHPWNPRPFSQGQPPRDRSARQRPDMALEGRGLSGSLVRC